MSLFGDDPVWVPTWHSFWNLKYLSSANLNSLNSPRNTYPECTNAGKNIFSMKINLVLLKPGSSGASLPHQEFTAFQGAVAEPGRNLSSTTCSQWGLAVLEQWLWMHSVEIEESPGTPSSAHQLSLVPPRCPWCPQVALGPCSQPWSAAAGTFGNTCQGELVLVLLKAEKTKAYQCHLGGERPLYCLISHAELEFQFKWTFWTKQIAFWWETWFRIAWSLNSFTWDTKAQLKFLEAHQCIHCSVSFPQGERKAKTAFLKSPSPLISCTSHAAEPLPALLHWPFILQRKRNGDFHRSSPCRISFPAERHWINLPSSRFVQNSVF